jgi:hypothetical protein
MSYNKGCQTTLAWSHTLRINWLHAEWQKNYSHTHRRNSGGVCSQGLSAEGHFITPAVLPDCRQTHTGMLWEWMLHTGKCTILISGKLLNNVSEILQEVLSMEHQWCDRTLLSIYPQKVQHLDQHFMKPGHLQKISASRSLQFVQSVGLQSA